MQTQITCEAGKIVVAGPYSESNNAIWRSLGGKFAGGNWVLPDNETSRVAVANLFGSKSDEVEVLVPVEKLDSNGQILQVGGYVLAQRRFRDGRVQMPVDVSLAAGSFPGSGGSQKNPRVNPSDDMVFRLRCRKSFAAANGLEIAAPVSASVEI